MPKTSIKEVLIYMAENNGKKYTIDDFIEKKIPVPPWYYKNTKGFNTMPTLPEVHED